MKELTEIPNMIAYMSNEYERILNKGIHIKQVDGLLTIGLIRKTFGPFYKFVRKICLLSSTEALVDYVPVKVERLKEGFIDMLSGIIPMIVDGMEEPLSVTCSPITGKARPEVIHDFTFVICEGISPLGYVQVCDVINNPLFMQPL